MSHYNSNDGKNDKITPQAGSSIQPLGIKEIRSLLTNTTGIKLMDGKCHLYISSVFF